MEFLLVHSQCIHVEGYIQLYCVHYNLTHEHKGTQWGGGGPYVEDHHQKYITIIGKKEIVQNPSITMPPALTALQSI